MASEQDILDEIKKCDLVCANCHAERTYQQELSKQRKEGDANDLQE